jgi:anaerobic magnesium-protoporphyrin IX monomethyl ester cyclase
MNVLLVSAYRGAIFELVGVSLQPLGLSYIGAVLRAAGHQVEIQMMEDAAALPDFTGADVVGISCNTVQFNSGLKIAKLAKALGKTVLMGGPHPSCRPEEALLSGAVDYVIRGEGELAAAELLEGLKAGKSFDPRKIPGISWIDRESQTVFHNPERPFIQDLDSLPFPIRESRLIYGGPVRNRPAGRPVDVPLITTRGCPYGCKFCDVHVLAGRRFRIRSVGNVVREIEELVAKQGAERILIVDDIINFDNERLIELFGALVERGIAVVRWVMGRGDHLLKDPGAAEAMGKAGVEQMFLGIESPNERILKNYKKGGKASSDTTIKAVGLLKQNGIETWGAFILGEPTETMEDVKRTVEFARWLNPGTAQFSVLTPYPGTDLWKEVEPRLSTKNWDLYDAMHSVFKPEHLDPRQLEQMLFKAYVGFYTQPKRILREMFKRDHRGSTDIKTIFRIVRGMKVIFPTFQNRGSSLSKIPAVDISGT